MRTALKVGCLVGSMLLLGLLTGHSDPQGPIEKSIRAQRARNGRAARVCVEHDWIESTANATSLQRATGDGSTGLADLPEPAFSFLPALVPVAHIASVLISVPAGRRQRHASRGPPSA